MRSARQLLGMTLLVWCAWAAACDLNSTEPVRDASPRERRVAAIVEITFSNIGSPNMQTSALVAGSVAQLEVLRAARMRAGATGQAFMQDLEVPTNSAGGGNATIQLDSVLSGSFTYTSAEGTSRYFQATYRVRNAQLTDNAAFDTPRRNLTFVPVSTTGTIPQTPVRVFRRSDGSNADPALALQLRPTGFAIVDIGGALSAAFPDVLQVFTEAEIAAAGVTPAVTNIFPYGFMVRRTGDTRSRTLSASPRANEFDGIINFAYRIPLQPNPADNPSTITLIMLALDDSDTQLTQSLEEQTLLARQASRERASSLNATTRTLLPGGTFPFLGGYRTICSVRTAGTAGAPLAFMINVPSAFASITPNPYAADGSGSFIIPTSAFQVTFTTPVARAATPPVHVRGLQSGEAFSNQTFTGFGTNTITTPNGAFFPGEEIELVITTAYSCPQPWVAHMRAANSPSTGTFAAPSAFAVGQRPAAVVAGDVNNDNIVDVVTANDGDNDISVLLGIGNGSFQAQRTFRAGANPASIALFDASHNGNLDVIVTNLSSASLLLGNGDGNFLSPLDVGHLPNVGAVTAGDVNGDAILDVVMASTRGELQVLLGGGGATFVGSLPTDPIDLPGERHLGLALADLNNDGRLDIVATDRRSDRAFFVLGNGNGTFQTEQFATVGDDPSGLAVGDLNRDGFPDLAVVNVGSNNVSILLGNGNGTFQAQRTFVTGPSPARAIAIGDLNGDGRLDVAVAEENGVAVLLGNGNGTLQIPLTYVLPEASSIALADLNRDGVLDIIVSNDLRDGTVSVLLGIR